MESGTDTAKKSFGAFTRNGFSPSLALIFIGTGDYAQFFPAWHEAMRRFVAPEVRRTFIAFTDAALPAPPDLVVIDQPHLPWPAISLRKWEIIARAGGLLASHSHLLYLDADMVAVRAIRFDEVFDRECAYVAVHDPSHWAGEPWIRDWPGEYETDPLSPAAVTEAMDPQFYWQACLWGGRTERALPALRELARRTRIDIDRGFTARWHDESYLNRFLIDCAGAVRTLGPEYACPPDWRDVGGRSPRIVHVAKDDAALKR